MTTSPLFKRPLRPLMMTFSRPAKKVMSPKTRRIKAWPMCTPVSLIFGACRPSSASMKPRLSTRRKLRSQPRLGQRPSSSAQALSNMLPQSGQRRSSSPSTSWQ